MKPTTQKIIEDAIQHQFVKFGREPLATHKEFVSILGEEFGEICRAVNQQNSMQTIKECVHCCAVIIAYIESDLHYGRQA
jgi:hypothetical protein